VGINPKLVFKLVLNPHGNLSDEELGRLGLRVLARDARKAVVVFPSEATLHDLRDHLEQYAGIQTGHAYAKLSAIEAIAELAPEDRTGLRLQKEPLGPDETASLDVELWHTGDQAECRALIQQVGSLLQPYGLKVTDHWVGTSLCLVRAQLNAAALNTLLATDFVKEIDRRSQPSFELVDVVRLGATDIRIDEVGPDDLVGVLVIDSGIMQQHPVLASVIGDAQVFPDTERMRITGGAEDGDMATGGHGTAVAGIAAYGDVADCIGQRVFHPTASLFSARVTDAANEYSEDELVEHQLDDAIRYFLTNYPKLKVINISLGDSARVYDGGRYQFRLAAAIDDLAYQYRDREVVLVISAGNLRHDSLSADQLVTEYPIYVWSPEARLIDPATSALAITVGGLSAGPGRDWRGLDETDTDRLIAGEKGWPSPFTRTGFGIGGAVKPEVVDYAGDLLFERGRVVGQPKWAGVPTTAKDFAPPDGHLFRTVAGTSFAAPRIANLAARLFREFPEASSNLIRALIADSARVPSNRPRALVDLDPWDANVLRTYGYGQPNFERARWSENNCVLLISDSVMEVGTVWLFSIPALPDEFRTTRGMGFISVTLAFDPPTRHTRADSYLGITMKYVLCKNVTASAVADALRTWTEEERRALGDDTSLPSLGTLGSSAVDLKPGSRTRGAATLQKAIRPVAGRSWQYDGQPLVLALICQREWAPPEITQQRFALVVSIQHQNPGLDLYSRLLEQTRVYQRVRIRV
jgi:hypothetical protein